MWQILKLAARFAHLWPTLSRRGFVHGVRCKSSEVLMLATKQISLHTVIEKSLG
jgi:hypothetical protein